MAFCDKCGKEIEKDHKFCQECDEQAKESIQQIKKEIKNNNRAHWIGIIGGGIIAGLSAKLLTANGVYLSFVPAVLLWLASYWIIKKIAEKM